MTDIVPRQPVDKPVFAESKILHAYWQTWTRGMIVLRQDWRSVKQLPPIYIDPGKKNNIRLIRESVYDFGLVAGFYCEEEQITFIVDCEKYEGIDWGAHVFYVVGDFNNWVDSIGKTEWQMQPDKINNKPILRLTVPKDWCVGKELVRFKFVSSERVWLKISMDVPNRVLDRDNNVNYEIHPDRTGWHRFYFELEHRADILGKDEVVWEHKQFVERVKINCRHLLLSLKTDQPMGVMVEKGRTLFRIFAPRANKVTLVYFEHLKNPQENILHLEIKDYVYWEGVVEANLHGYYYYYLVDGDNLDAFSHFDPTQKILDPYAIAAVGPEGPGIVVDKELIPKINRDFVVPEWPRLVILEGHVRDLVMNAPIDIEKERRWEFGGLIEWMNKPLGYLRSLGINALELQPLTLADTKQKEEYSWGYMPVNFFAPMTGYCKNGETFEQIVEVQQLVNTCHEHKIAVILDVVYNHCGEPNHLLYLDKYHYFEVNEEGYFMNYSGCGNDYRASAPMAKRMIIDSLKHWVETYDVDGFRFDLAELLGREVLMDIEIELKKIKPSIILIAEPWSFRGHIGYELKNTGYSSWNDGYRNFVHAYVLGKGNWDSIQYYIQGSLSYLSRFPAQSVNYFSSHDDHCFLDAITENMHQNGLVPTIRDRERVHLAIALLMVSIGIPMLAQGTDLLSTKQGIGNTYKRGDLNALDYNRGLVYSGTHEYCKRWIRFRLSSYGSLLCLEKTPQKDYFQFFFAKEASASAILYNANGELGSQRLLFAINPHVWPVTITVSSINAEEFKQIADHERFQIQGLSSPLVEWKNECIYLEPLCCGLWIKY